MTRHNYVSAGQFKDTLEKVFAERVLSNIPRSILGRIIVALSDGLREASGAENEAIRKLLQIVRKVYENLKRNTEEGGDNE